MQLLTKAVGGAAALKATQTNVKLVVLTPAAAAAVLTLTDNGSGGIVLQAAASGNSVVVPFPDGLPFGTNVTATLTGAGSVGYVLY